MLIRFAPIAVMLWLLTACSSYTLNLDPDHFSTPAIPHAGPVELLFDDGDEDYSIVQKHGTTTFHIQVAEPFRVSLEKALAEGQLSAPAAAPGKPAMASLLIDFRKRTRVKFSLFTFGDIGAVVALKATARDANGNILFQRKYKERASGFSHASTFLTFLSLGQAAPVAQGNGAKEAVERAAKKVVDKLAADLQRLY